MTTYVIGPDVALRLAVEQAVPAHQLLAPTLIRSQALALLYQRVRRGELTRPDANRHLDHLRSLKLRLLGDRVLQKNAWSVAEQLGHPDTYDAEYIALARLHADAFVTTDPRLAEAARDLITVAPYENLL